MSGGTMAKLTMPLCPNCGIVTMRTPCPFCEQIAHAVDLEREAIAAMIEARSERFKDDHAWASEQGFPGRASDSWDKHLELAHQAERIRAGAHNAHGSVPQGTVVTNWEVKT